MDFVEFSDDGSAPEIFATGVARIAKMSGGDTVRVTYFSERESLDGSIERRAVCDVVMGLQSWTDAQLLASEASRIIRATIASNGERDGRRREAN